MATKKNRLALAAGCLASPIEHLYRDAARSQGSFAGLAAGSPGCLAGLALALAGLAAWLFPGEQPGLPGDEPAGPGCLALAAWPWLRAGPTPLYDQSGFWAAGCGLRAAGWRRVDVLAFSRHVLPTVLCRRLVRSDGHRQTGPRFGCTVARSPLASLAREVCEWSVRQASLLLV